MKKKINKIVDNANFFELIQQSPHNIKLNQFYKIIKESDGELKRAELLYSEGMANVAERTIFKTLDRLFKSADNVARLIPDNFLIKRLKRCFRNYFFGHLSNSEIYKRGLLKPRGYPGDGEIIEWIYDRRIVSKGIGQIYDRYFHAIDYVKAVRLRKNIMRKILKKYLERDTKVSKIKILNLACGTCREIRDLFEGGIELKSMVEFTLVDHDRITLKFAKRKLPSMSNKLNYKFSCLDVLSFTKKNCNSKMHLYFDMIYCIGLADYLPDSILGPLIRNSYEMLSRGGKFYLAHKNVKEFSTPGSDWGADWKFIPRNECEVKKIFYRNIGNRKSFLKLFFDESKRIFFIELEKK